MINYHSDITIRNSNVLLYIGFDTIISSAERNAELTHWYGEETFTEAGDQHRARAVFAVNLLNAELRFKRCESHNIGSHEQQKDLDILTFAVPNLLLFASAASDFDSSRQILELRLRCYWLACTYYLWVGNCSNEVSMATAAEDLSLNYLNRTMVLLSDNSQCYDLRIRTPHLISPDRRGDHWDSLSVEGLSKFKEHIHSSTIVSRARQSFQDIQWGMIESGSICDVNLNVDVVEKLTLLGSKLLEKYNFSGENSDEIMDNLLSDFLLVHGDDLSLPDLIAVSATASNFTLTREVYWGKIWTKIPTSNAVFTKPKESANPSIVQIMATSLLISNEKIPLVFLMYLKVGLAALTPRSKPCFHEENGVLQNKFEETEAELYVDDHPVSDVHSRRDYLLMHAVNFFTDKMADIVSSVADNSKQRQGLESYIVGEDICRFIFASFHVSPTHQKHYTNQLRSVSRLVHSIRHCQWIAGQHQKKIECVYFVGLVKAIIRQKIDFVNVISSTCDLRTKAWQSQTTSKAGLIFFLASEVAELLSLNPSVFGADGTTRVSHLIKAINAPDSEESYSVLAQLAEALLWFWAFVNDTTSPAANPIRSFMLIPISSAIIALCGSHGISMEGEICKVDYGSDRGALSFSDYFDSEDSVNGSFLPCDSAEDEEQGARRFSLKKICQLVQCVSIVFQSVDDKLIEQFVQSLPSSRHGPFLPLVLVRILSNMSQGLFQLFSEDTRGDAYPYGARECGATIDSLLGKAYQYLHGFSLSSGDSVSSNSFAPESIDAAANLFYCIKRVSDGRKVPPKAFEIVELALPPAEESDVSKAIKAFLFDADKSTDVAIQPLAMSHTSLPLGFPEWIFDIENGTPSVDEQGSKIENLRRGVAFELAKGSMINLDIIQKPISDMEKQGLSAERESTQTHELSLSHKFKAVLHDLCYDPKQVERWVVLSECLGFKADLICDRLVRSKEPFDSSDFGLNLKSKRGQAATMTLDQLQKSQLDDYHERSKNWRPFLGNNLHVYMEYPWSNLSSLEACAKEVRSCISLVDGNNDDLLCWKEIESKFDTGNYLSWANSWGGLFVGALRNMRLKALLVARYLSKNSRKGMHPSEVCEDLGTAVYSDLMASTVYGYPIHLMTLYEKRSIAERSNFHFKEAIDLSSCSEYTQKCHIKPFESLFMIGKGYEKIGSTLKEEAFVLDSEGAGSPRSYETVMNHAIANYAMAFAEAQKVEQSCGGNDRLGGSSHGALECLYRLHASRFKVLLSAVKCPQSECELAELEAFRIASSRWFDESFKSSSSAGVREKTWDVFADCVNGKCTLIKQLP